MDGPGRVSLADGVAAINTGAMPAEQAPPAAALCPYTIAGTTPFVAASAPGCHIGDAQAPWILGHRCFRHRDFGLKKSQRPPDLSVEPTSHILTLINETETPRIYFVSVRSHRCYGAARAELPAASWRDGRGVLQSSVTFIVRLAPREVIDVARLRDVRSLRRLERCISSDIVLQAALSLPQPSQLPLSLPQTSVPAARVEVLPHASDVAQLPSAAESEPLLLHFPYHPGKTYLCSQASAGGLTHFAHPSTYYAVDIDAPIGTPVLAVMDGIIHSLECSNDAGGPDVSCMFSWNSLVLLGVDGLTSVEYVR